MIELTDVSVATPSGRMRLRDVTCSLEQGLIYAVIGPNGAGKSTLLNVMGATLAPTSGTVTLAGIDTRTQSVKNLAQLRAVLPQSIAVSFGFTVEQVVAWGRTPWRKTPHQREDRSAINTAITTLGLDSLRDRPIHELSGGERKRVHIARILAQHTEIVILDEPDSDLDLGGVAELEKVVRNMQLLGKTIVYTAHDLGRVSTLADSLILVSESTIIALGTPENVLTGDLLSKGYGRDVDVRWEEIGSERKRAVVSVNSQ